jgi:hypothetical protein
MKATAQEMVDDGYNHPSIILWGIFNEPKDNFQTQFTKLNAALQQLDSTRHTSIYGAASQIPYLSADIYGMNYELYPNTNIRSQVAGSFVSEYYEGWIKWCYRGDTAVKNDAGLSGSLSENRFAADRWSGSNNWTQVLAAWNAATQPVPGGGFMWCFADYWSPVQDYPMGVLDHYRIPKKAFYTFRSNWTSAAADHFVLGISPTRVQLGADVMTLVADSTDITRIIGSLRDDAGQCAFVSRSITLHMTGPIDCFDSLTKTTIAGKTGWVLKSKNSPGAVRVVAASAGLSPDTITIACAAPDHTPQPFIWPANSTKRGAPCFRGAVVTRVRQKQGRISVSFSFTSSEPVLVTLNAPDGKIIGKFNLKNGSSECINIKHISPGMYFLRPGSATAMKIAVTD